MLHVASDAIMKVYRKGLFRTGRSTPATIEIAIDRWAHAYRPNSESTLCGLKVKKLHWEPFQRLDFAAVNGAFHCPRCSALATM
jgi:hypothetical protein